MTDRLYKITQIDYSLEIFLVFGILLKPIKKINFIIWKIPFKKSLFFGKIHHLNIFSEHRAHVCFAVIESDDTNMYYILPTFKSYENMHLFFITHKK